MVQLVRKDGKLVRHQGRLATSCDCCEPPLECVSKGKTGVGNDTANWPLPPGQGLMSIQWSVQGNGLVDIRITAGGADFFIQQVGGVGARTFCKPANAVSVEVEIIDPTNAVLWQYELRCLRLPCPAPAKPIPVNPLP